MVRGVERARVRFPEALFYELGGVPTDKIVEVLNERHGCSMPVEGTAAFKDSLFIEMIPQMTAD